MKLSIADEVAAALKEAGEDVNGAALTVTVTRKVKPAQQNNVYSDTPELANETFSFAAFDMGWVNQYSGGSLVPVSVHKLLVEKGQTQIVNSDKLNISGIDHEIFEVKPFAPFGESIYQEVYLKT